MMKRLSPSRGCLLSACCTLMSSCGCGACSTAVREEALSPTRFPPSFRADFYAAPEYRPGWLAFKWLGHPLLPPAIPSRTLRRRCTTASGQG
ncbi:hypothetical protein IWX92DRAFT_60621 [Phyllosticta citricarpa]